MARNFSAAMLALSCALAACATFDNDVGQETIDCSSEEECDIAWSTGVTWIADNSGFFFQTQTDLLATTFCGGILETKPCYQMTRTRREKGKSRIEIRVGCRNGGFCYPSAGKQVIFLAARIRTAVDRFRSVEASDARKEEIERTGKTPTPKDLFPRK